PRACLMKTGAFLIGLTCTAVGLIAAIARINKSAQPVIESAAMAPEAESPAPLRTQPVAKADDAPVSLLTSQPFHWSQVESTDYKQYIMNLRAVGCPESTIRDIILADINKLYAPREEPLKARRGDGQTKPDPAS